MSDSYVKQSVNEIKEELTALRQQVATLQKPQSLIDLEAFNSRTPYSELREQLASAQKDNDSLKADLKETEGAVADLMELNDTLTADEDLSLNTIVKLKAKVTRLREALEQIKDRALCNFAMGTAEEALNHKEK